MIDQLLPVHLKGTAEIGIDKGLVSLSSLSCRSHGATGFQQHLALSPGLRLPLLVSSFCVGSGSRDGRS